MTSVRIAAIADVHFGRHPASALQPLFSRLGDEADVLLICGDPHRPRPSGRSPRARPRDPAALTIPVVGVLGNHDCESGQEAEVRTIMAMPVS
jgi:predicted MPP superfamily phosphohydrolase